LALIGKDQTGSSLLGGYISLNLIVYYTGGNWVFKEAERLKVPFVHRNI
jgi:hypothetical protein